MNNRLGAEARKYSMQHFDLSLIGPQNLKIYNFLLLEQSLAAKCKF
jgi:hypothetical protein